MKSPKPPMLATWLLEHLLPGGRNDALAGDLLERFNQNHSVAWYWREVLAAILIGISKRLAILWIAAGFTVVWISALFLYISPHLWMFLLKLPWTDSIIDTTGFFTVIHALPLPVALGLYLGMTRSFSQRRFLVGILAGLVALISGNAIFWVHVNVHSLGGAAIKQALPLFFALMVSMWVAQLNNPRTRPARIPA